MTPTCIHFLSKSCPRLPAIGPMIRILALVLIIMCTLAAAAQDAPLGQTPTWSEAIEAFATLHEQHPARTTFVEFGISDVGRPLHLFTMGPDSAPLKMLINNAIHPGEPCGVNASIQWATELLESENLPEGVCIGIVPLYNVGGGLRRNCCTRANQLGPEEYGFRGNARNLDLNRDFIKCDSRNALSFNAMFTAFDPDLFVDTHTSNGSDYQATMTLIATQPDKLGGPLGTWLELDLLPELYADMAAQGTDMTPYVYNLGDTPDEGIQDFLETPRFSTGYAALHHTVGFTTEAHMLKPFADRVAATRQFLSVLLAAGLRHANELQALRQAQDSAYRNTSQHPVDWTLDTTAVDSLSFKGYEARYEWSTITGSKRLRYDHDAPWTRNVAHLHTFQPAQQETLPAAFIVPQAWRHVTERLDANGVEWHPIRQDTILLLSVSHITNHSASSRPYEGHHLRTVGTMTTAMEEVQIFAGDRVIPCDQPAARYLLETLSPRGVDSFFRWNFFDSVLQQKEYFSSYVFEDTAAELVKSNPSLQAALDSAKAEQKEGGLSARAQLDFIYQRSPHSEGTAGRYPIYRIPAGHPLPYDE